MQSVTNGVRYAFLAALVLVIAVVGFAAFVSYLRLDLAAFAGSGLLLLGVAAGAASFFSPCSFPLLVTLLARVTGAEKKDSPAPTGKALQFGAALAVGVSLFLLLLGAAVAAGAGPLVRQVTFTSAPGRILRLVVGAGLILLGLRQMTGRIGVADRLKERIVRAQARTRRRSSHLGFGLFGFGYVLAGFG